jgi:nucleoside 2-deoxyribosyltransferase
MGKKARTEGEEMSAHCPFCNRNVIQEQIPIGRKVECNVCGQFEITSSAEPGPNLEERARQKIGFWTRDQNDLGDIPRVTSYTADKVKILPDKTVLERAERLLRFGIAEQKDLGGVFKIASEQAIGITHSRSPDDVLALGHLLHIRGWLHPGYSGGAAQITPMGFIHASEGNISESTIGFIAMWFDSSMSEARSVGFEPAIYGAGYNPVIVSGVEHINKIDDEIISQIRKSKFLVADFTGHRGGVYFEAGFAMGLGMPVFWSCRRNDLSNLHFDVRQYNCIDWTDPADLAVRLKRRIEEVIGTGPIRAGMAARSAH